MHNLVAYQGDEDIFPSIGRKKVAEETYVKEEGKVVWISQQESNFEKIPVRGDFMRGNSREAYMKRIQDLEQLGLNGWLFLSGLFVE